MFQKSKKLDFWTAKILQSIILKLTEVFICFSYFEERFFI